MQTCRHRSFGLVLALVSAFLLLEVERLDAHDDQAWQMLADGDASRTEWFETLKTPSGQSCCSLSDCRQTRAAWRGDTQGWWAQVNGTWRPVPADKVLSSPRSIDGEAYICLGEDSYGDMRHPLGSPRYSLWPLPGLIYCFVPPDLGS